jgi:hypothetical protein
MSGFGRLYSSILTYGAFRGPLKTTNVKININYHHIPGKPTGLPSR